MIAVAGCQATPTPMAGAVAATPVDATLAVLSIPAPDVTIGTSNSPLAGPEPLDATSDILPTPLPSAYIGLEQYRGNNAHTTEAPHFEVWYDPTIWEIYETNRLGGHTLAHRHILECTLQLGTGPVGTEGITSTTVQLAGRTWYVATWISVPIPHSEVNLYATGEGNAGFFFSMLVPEESSVDERTRCREAAETVIDTFSIVTETN